MSDGERLIALAANDLRTAERRLALAEKEVARCRLSLLMLEVTYLPRKES